ncbi:MAG: glycosyltransferase family 2 protein [Myxococcota bacterium]|nr:glycosyltransferase family 2 protein [Myxococcota bacterium]
MTIHILIITRNGGELFEKCLRSVEKQLQSSDRIVIVHSAPLRKPLFTHKSIYTHGFRGYAHAVNVGISSIPYSHWLILNDDTCLEPNCVEVLRKQLFRPAIYQPQIRSMNSPSRIENAGHWIFLDGFNIARGRGALPSLELPKYLPVFSGASALLHKTVIEQVGAFDEDLHSFGEDVDWSLRAIRKGFPIQYVPEAIVYHKLGATFGRSSRQKARWVERNRVQAIIRSMPRHLLLQVPFWTFYRFIVQSLGAAIGRGVASQSSSEAAIGAILGNIEGWSKTRDAWKKRKEDRLDWRLRDRPFYEMLKKHHPPLRDVWHPKEF